MGVGVQWVVIPGLWAVPGRLHALLPTALVLAPLPRLPCRFSLEDLQLAAAMNARDRTLHLVTPRTSRQQQQAGSSDSPAAEQTDRQTPSNRQKKQQREQSKRASE